LVGRVRAGRPERGDLASWEAPLPYTTEFVDGGRGVLRVGSGIVTSVEILDATRELQGDPERAGRLRYGLVDLTEVTELRLTSQDMRRIAEASLKIAKLVPGGVVAIIAPKDHDFGMARMWEHLVDEADWITRVFRNRVEADAWIREQLAAGPPQPASPTA
jgi:hypothetical protein